MASLIEGLDKFRRRITWIYEKHFDPEEKNALALAQPKSILNTVLYVVMLIAVSIGTAILVSRAINPTAPELASNAHDPSMLSPPITEDRSPSALDYWVN